MHWTAPCLIALLFYLDSGSSCNSGALPGTPVLSLPSYLLLVLWRLLSGLSEMSFMTSL